MTKEITGEISIKVETRYLKEHPATDEGKFAFSYRITITNLYESEVQLLHRHWLITDANAKRTEVNGPGVVGQQPKIGSGKSFQYTSGAILETPVGTMEGHYELQLNNGLLAKVPIPVFSLAVPNSIN